MSAAFASTVHWENVYHYLQVSVSIVEFLIVGKPTNSCLQKYVQYLLKKKTTTLVGLTSGRTMHACGLYGYGEATMTDLWSDLELSW